MYAVWHFQINCCWHKNIYDQSHSRTLFPLQAFFFAVVFWGKMMKNCSLIKIWHFFCNQFLLFLINLIFFLIFRTFFHLTYVCIHQFQLPPAAAAAHCNVKFQQFQLLGKRNHLKWKTISCYSSLYIFLNWWQFQLFVVKCCGEKCWCEKNFKLS